MQGPRLLQCPSIKIISCLVNQVLPVVFGGNPPSGRTHIPGVSRRSIVVEQSIGLHLGFIVAIDPVSPLQRVVPRFSGRKHIQVIAIGKLGALEVFLKPTLIANGHHIVGLIVKCVTRLV